MRKRLTELAQMQQRLLDGCLAGGVDQETFTARSAALKLQAARLRERLADAAVPDAELSQSVMEAFDLAGCHASASVCRSMPQHFPFEESRCDCPSFEPLVEAFFAAASAVAKAAQWVRII